MESKIEFSLKLEAQDVVDFQKSFIFKKSNIIRIAVRSLLLIVAAIMLLNISSYFSQDARGILAIWSVTMIFLAIGLPLLRYYRLMKLTRKVFRSKISNYNERHYLLDNEKIIQRKDNNNMEFYWKEILKAHKDKKIIALYFSLNEAFIFPVRKLDDSTFNELNKLLRDKGLC